MRKMFLGYYRPTEKEFSNLWKNCLFVLDANILLNLYRYTKETSAKLLEILNIFSDRLWIPHQAALEYQRNRLKVIDDQIKAYDKLRDELDKHEEEIVKTLTKYIKHSLLNVGQWHKPIGSLFSKIRKKLYTQKGDHPDLFKHDSLREDITLLLEGKIGPPYSPKRLKEIFREGQERYADSIPPGYKDDNTKSGNEKYGDLVLWFQMIDKAKEAKKPMIYVTDDTKEDWWEKFLGKTIGPRPELVQEFYSEVKEMFYIYKSDIFITYAGEYLRREVDQKAVKEIRELRSHDEKSLALTEGVKLSDELEIIQIQQAHLASDIARLESEKRKMIGRLVGIEAELSTMEFEGKGDAFSIRQLALQREQMELKDQFRKLENDIEKFTENYEKVLERRIHLEQRLKDHLTSSTD